ncbi:cation transporter dimerization domain-containing protein [Parathermosynechococcus lividus]
MDRLPRTILGKCPMADKRMDRHALRSRLFLGERLGIACLHDLHIWTMSMTETALMAHLVMPDGHSGDDFLHQVSEELHHDFASDHTTLQIVINKLITVLILAS